MDVRPARADDVEAVTAFTSDTWDQRGDYLPEVFEEWVTSDDDRQRTLVADDDGDPVGVVQAVVLTDQEAWLQGLRVHPDHRGQGVGEHLTRAGLTWARDRGAVVARAMVFSWNAAGLGVARAAGFDPATEFRWVHPEPTADASPGRADAGGPVATVDAGRDAADAAWSWWTGADARDHLRGLALAPEESWACRELARRDLRDAAETGGLVVAREGGVAGFAHRVREFDREGVRWAEYGVAAWVSPGACGALLAGVARDAAAAGADRVRALVPESARWASDAALAGVTLADGPDFVLAADLTALD